MKKIKSYNQITEEKIEDPWDEQLYSETYTVNIKNLRYDMIDLLKTWCKEYNITPKSSSISINSETPDFTNSSAITLPAEPHPITATFFVLISEAF